VGPLAAEMKEANGGFMPAFFQNGQTGRAANCWKRWQTIVEMAYLYQQDMAQGVNPGTTVRGGGFLIPIDIPVDVFSPTAESTTAGHERWHEGLKRFAHHSAEDQLRVAELVKQSSRGWNFSDIPNVPDPNAPDATKGDASQDEAPQNPVPLLAERLASGRD
jgi:hypothetical protein